MFRSFKVCQYCNAPIYRSGIQVFPAWGKGYRHEGFFAHKGCFKNNKYKRKPTYPKHLSFWAATN